MRAIDLSESQKIQLTSKIQIAATSVTRVSRANLVYDGAEAVEVVVKTISLSALYEHDAFDRAIIAKRLNRLRTLQHPHICPIHDARLEDNHVQIIMPHLPDTLADQLPEKGFPVARVRGIFTQLADALTYAHATGVLHLNLKPDNVLFDQDGQVCLSDFTISHLPELDERVIFGTPAYLAPEQIQRTSLSAQADVYALACLLYTLLTGTPPFSTAHGLDEVQVLHKQLHEPPVAISERKAELPASLDAVLSKALAKDPQARYESIAQFKEAVLSAMNRPDEQPAHTPVSRVRLPAFARPLIVALGFLLIVSAAVIIANLLGERGVDEESTRKLVEQPAIVFGEIWTPEQLEVAPGELQQAQNELGNDGFVAFIACNRTSEYYATIAREVVSFAANRSLPVTVYDAQTDPYAQPILIEQARVDGAVGFVVCALDMEILTEPLQQLIVDEIPVVLTSGMISGAVVVRENDRLLAEPVGHYAGEFIRDELGGEANVVVLNFPQLPTLVQREEALVESMLEVAPGAEVVVSSTGGTSEFGYNSVRLLLETGVDFNVILSINDAGSYGAIEALEEAGIAPGAVHIFSVDAELRARQYIEQDYFLRASVSAGRMASAQAIVNSMIKLLAGTPVAEQIEISPGPLITTENTPN